MKLYWRISSFPELEHLTPEQKQSILDRSGGCLTMLHLGLRAFLRGLFATMVVALLATAFPEESSRKVLAYALPPFFILAVTLAYAITVTQMRGQLRAYLETIQRNEGLSLCLNCGYDLEGVEADVCPECGKMIPLKKAE